jgi:hypothetical protein
MTKIKTLLAALALFASSAFALDVPITSGPLTMTAFDYTAGAFCSLTYNGVQYIDAKDHGRCLQSASSFDWLGEAFNPTEAGASMFTDGFLPQASSSKILNGVFGSIRLATETQMAYWNPVAGKALSNHILRKYVEVGYAGMPNLVDYRVQFEIPAGESHSIGQFEILTGYMPTSFSEFYALNGDTLQPLSDGPGEQGLPIIFATSDGSNAIGVYSTAPLTGGGYGRFRFTDCVKWNLVTRIANPRGTYRFRMILVVGTVAQVVDGLKLAKTL